MGKGKTKRSSDANEAPKDGANAVSNTPAASDVPNIDESAFAGLRQKIEQRLKDQNSGKGKSKKNDKNPAPAAASNPNKGKESPAKGGKKQDSAQGKKRDRNGDVIAREEKDKSAKAGKAGKKGQDQDTLRQEILALGGTEDDLDLLDGVDSEAEVEGIAAKSGDDDLRKELSKMLEAAGHVVPEDLGDDDVEEEEEEEDEDEEEEQDEEDAEDVDISDDEQSDAGQESEISDIEETPKAKAAKSDAPETVHVPKEYAKLVS